VTCKEQLYLLKARTGDRRAVLDALAVLAEYELHPQHQALGKALLLSALGRRQEALEEVAAAGSLARTSTFMELVAYAHLELGQRESGCRLLHRFWVTAEVSRLPMLDRDQRLNRAKETLRSYWRRPSRRDSRKV
jgi:hypothetical protein